MSPILLTPPVADDCEEFLAAAARSRELLEPWVQPPGDRDAFAAWLRRLEGDRNLGLLVRRRTDGALAGVVNLSEIVRGCFCSCYLGYYALQPLAGQGLMRHALQAAIAHAFGPLQLHRVEANVQPGNERSLALIRRLGFRREGYSPRYLHLAGEWRDHERWALTEEDLQ